MGHRDNAKVLWQWYATTLSQAKVSTYFKIALKGYQLEEELLEYHEQQEKLIAAQIEKLKAAGCERIYSESLSGKNTKRPELQGLLKALRNGDCVYIVKLDSLYRSMKDMFTVTEEIKEAGAGLVSLDGGIDTSDSSPCKELLWQLLSSIAQFERALILNRCSEGRAKAKKRGKHL